MAYSFGGVGRDRRRRSGVWAGCLVAAGLGLVGLAPPSGAEPLETCSGPGPVPAGLSPASLDGPTPVEVGVYLLELREIDAVADSFQFRGYVHVSWCDPSQAFDPVAEGREERLLSGDALEALAGRIWTPAGFPVNRAGPFDRSERLLHLRHDGRLIQDLNFEVRLSADYDLRRFPFDRQVLELQIESFAWNRDQLVWVADDARIGFAHDFEVPEWRVLAATGRVEEVAVRRSDVPFSRFVLAVEIERASDFYLWKVLLPLLLILALSWSVFWMSEESFATRSRVSATGVLTVVAYQFAAAGNLPRVAYLTLLDQIMILSFVMLAMTVPQSLWVVRTRETDPVRARRIDRRSRWLFPLTYAAVIALIVRVTG